MRAGGPKFCLENTDAATWPTLVPMEIEFETYSFICTQQLQSCKHCKNHRLKLPDTNSAASARKIRTSRFKSCTKDPSPVRSNPNWHRADNIFSQPGSINPRERNVLKFQGAIKNRMRNSIHIRGSRERNTFEIQISSLAETRTNLRWLIHPLLPQDERNFTSGSLRRSNPRLKNAKM